MKTFVTATAAAVFALGATAASAGVPGEYNRGEERLARMLEGHVQSGEPKQCISTISNRNIQVVEHVGIVYDAGKTIWVARARNGQYIDSNDLPVIHRWNSSQLCANDRIQLVDRGSGMYGGVLFLEDFVPYTRVENAEG